MKFFSLLKSRWTLFVGRVRVARAMAKIAMSTPSWDTKTLTRKILRYQDSVKRDPVATNANFYIGLLDNSAEQHVDFDVTNKQVTIKFKME